MTPSLAHSTPFRSRRSLAKVSTNSREPHLLLYRCKHLLNNPHDLNLRVGCLGRKCLQCGGERVGYIFIRREIYGGKE